MKTIITILVVAFLVIVAYTAMNAQPRPAMLPNLGWVPGTLEHRANREAQVNFDVADFVIGWNWAAPVSIFGDYFRARRQHVADNFDDWPTADHAVPDNMQVAFLRNFVSGVQLVPGVRGMSDEMRNGGQISNPSEAPAMEFEPWLTYDATTDDVVLENTDHDGGIFGFQVRNGGERTGNGSNPTIIPPIPYRWQFGRALTAAPEYLALDEPTTDDKMRLWWPNHHIDPIVGEPNDVLNTRILRVAVTLRRMEADPLGSNATDVILSIRLPYVLGTTLPVPRAIIPHNVADRTLANGVRYIEFDRMPLSTTTIPAGNPMPQLHVTPNAVTNLNPPGFYSSPPPPAPPAGPLATLIPSARLSVLQDPAIDLNDHITTFNITRDMLPPMVGNEAEEVTIYAEFRCDFTPGLALFDGPRNNAEIARHDGPAAPDRIDRLGIEVRHHPDVIEGLGVEIRSVRIETPHATNVLFGDFDDQIQEQVNRFVDNVRDRLNLDDGPHGFTTLVGAPIPGGGTNQPATIWRFYGRDEAEMMHWLVFRRINMMLGGRLITEVGSWFIDKQKHCLRESTVWQGTGFATNNNISTYTARLGWDRYGIFLSNDHDPTVPVAAHELQDRFEFSYAGIQSGIDNLIFNPPVLSATSFIDDPDTFLEQRDKWPRPLACHALWHRST